MVWPINESSEFLSQMAEKSLPFCVILLNLTDRWPLARSSDIEAEQMKVIHWYLALI